MFLVTESLLYFVSYSTRMMFWVLTINRPFSVLDPHLNIIPLDNQTPIYHLNSDGYCNIFFLQTNFNRILDYRDFNCSSIIELCYRLPEIFYIRDDPNSPTMAFPALVGVSSAQPSGEFSHYDSCLGSIF